MAKKKKLTYTSLRDNKDIHSGYEQALETVRGEFGQHHPMYIGGRRVAAIEDFETRSPIDTDLVVGTFQKGGEAETRSAVAEATASFPAWSQTDWEERVRIIRAIADVIEKQSFPLAALMTYEAGKNRFEALAEVCEAVEMLRYNCAIYEGKNGFTVPLSDVTGERSISTMQPYGVWAIISPFNFPLVLAAGMVSAALLTGNTVVFKPTSKAPLTGLKLHAACVQAGVPGGALNFITGPGTPFGAVVVAHPDVAGIAFNGVPRRRDLAAAQFLGTPALSKAVCRRNGQQESCHRHRFCRPRQGGRRRRQRSLRLQRAEVQRHVARVR